VNCVWQCQGLKNINKRLNALKVKVARDGLAFTEAQIATLETTTADK